MTLFGFGALISGGLLVAGGVTIMKGRPAVQNIGGVLSLLVSVGFLVVAFSNDFTDDVGGIFIAYPLIYAVLPIIALALGNSGAVRAWGRTSPGV